MEKIRPYLRRGEEHQAPASSLVEGILAQLKFDPGLYAAFEICEKEIRSVVRGCEVAALNGSRLVVRVPSVVHRQELMYSKTRIVDRVNQALGKRKITDIQFEISTPSSLRGA